MQSTNGNNFTTNLNKYVNLQDFQIFTEEDKRSKSQIGHLGAEWTSTDQKRSKSAQGKNLDMKKCKEYFQQDKKLVETQL